VLKSLFAVNIRPVSATSLAKRPPVQNQVATQVLAVARPRGPRGSGTSASLRGDDQVDDCDRE